MAIHPRKPCWKWLLPPLRRNNYRMRRCKCSYRIIFGRSTWTQMVNVIGRLICRTMCRKITQFKMSHYFQRVYWGLPGFYLEHRWWVVGAGLSHRQLHKTHQQLLFHCSTSTTPHLCAGDAWLGFAVPLFSLLLFQTQNHSQYRTDCVRCENFGRRKASFTSYQRRTIGNCKQCKQSFFHFE